MKFDEKLKKLTAEDIWNEYCGFLDLSMDEYMGIQERLLMEQIDLLSKCDLGKKLFGAKVPASVAEFRKNVPLTTYSDYADILLMKRVHMLPAEPVLWLQTTWEGGDFPAKVAPYSASMLETYKKNSLTAMILATSTGRGKFRMRRNAKILYSLAPMPYITGMFPEAIDSELTLRWLPSLKEAKKLSFSQKTRTGFELSVKVGMNYIFGMSSILHGMSKSFSLGSGEGGGGALKKLVGTTPARLVKILVALYRSKRDNRPVLPRDLFNLDAFVCAGTDSALYKDEFEEAWGIRPLEVFGGTEPSLMGVETWSKNGLVFFPDACFYEFIPENEMMRGIKHPGYKPNTYLMNELVANQNYELVITVLKGGALARYRVGDVYRCLRVKNKQDKLAYPQFEYVDRIPTVIDIAGFTRITEKEIQTVIKLSSLPISDWFALKEYDDSNHSYLHIYVEMKSTDGDAFAMAPHIIKEHMNVYFRFYDGDYKDLKKMLGVDPLKVTLLKTGTISKYKKKFGVEIPKVNPSMQEIIELLHLNDAPGEVVLACQ